VAIELKTAMPGPRARAAIARDHAVVSQSYVRDPETPVVVERAQGAWVWDVDGNCLLDIAAGIATCSTGHCHPDVVAAIEQQGRRLIHMSGTDFYYLPQIELAEKIASLVPGEFQKRVFFGNSGAEAVEAALKLARYKTRRPNLIACFGAFHGRTMGALSLTASKAVQRKHFAPLLPGVLHVPYPYCYRCPEKLEPETCGIACLNELTDVVFKRLAPPDDVAAVFIEPIQGEGGYVPAPVEYLRRLREITRSHGILLVFDEIQSGMGRTGRMFAHEWASVEPDIVCVAKGIASGLPLGLMIYRSDETDWESGSHASTFGGNPVSCAAALKTIELLQGGLIENAARLGDYLTASLRQLQKNHPCIGDVRGRGLMVGAEIVRDAASREPAPQTRQAILSACYRRGLIIIGCGESTIRFAPALVITKDEITEALALFEAAVTEVEADGV
jgi:4-aminobutyrate aminotransferase